LNLRRFFSVEYRRSNAPKLAPDSDGFIWLPDEAFEAAFAQNASADQRAVLAAMQRPISINCITVPVGRPLWKDVPSWFLVAEDDRMIVPEMQRYMAERMKANTRAHAVDHTPSVTAPAVVVDITPGRSLRSSRLTEPKIGPVNPHPVHDDGQFAGNCEC
jgi:pimeloyl-ACP methyl ester carboxylesterase